MSTAIAPGVVPHVEAARRLLRELDRHADAAALPLNSGSGAEFLAAVQEREALFEELSRVCAALAHERVISADHDYGNHSEAASAVFGELAEAVDAAEATHRRLVARAREERDRLRASRRRANEPDT